MRALPPRPMLPYIADERGVPLNEASGQGRPPVYWKHAETVNTTSYLRHVSPRRDYRRQAWEISSRTAISSKGLAPGGRAQQCDGDQDRVVALSNTGAILSSYSRPYSYRCVRYACLRRRKAAGWAALLARAPKLGINYELALRDSRTEVLRSIASLVIRTALRSKLSGTFDQGSRPLQSPCPGRQTHRQAPQGVV
ncbi:hypothetical protein BDV10DRAFT_39337 [Aspergillus recurvatus]